MWCSCHAGPFDVLICHAAYQKQAWTLKRSKEDFTAVGTFLPQGVENIPSTWPVSTWSWQDHVGHLTGRYSCVCALAYVGHFTCTFGYVGQPPYDWTTGTPSDVHMTRDYPYVIHLHTHFLHPVFRTYAEYCICFDCMQCHVQQIRSLHKNSWLQVPMVLIWLTFQVSVEAMHTKYWFERSTCSV